MNRREFFTLIGGASVVSMTSIRPAFAAEQTTNLYLNGLLMVSFEDHSLRVGFPKAAGHKGTLKIVPVNGSTRTIAVKGNGIVETAAPANGRPKVFAPEAVQMSEIYGAGVKANFEKCPHIIEIPYAAIKSITSSSLTKDRWTFVRSDSKQEIDTFRPRQIAEGLKLELMSNSVLKLDGGKILVKLESTQEILCSYAPEPKDIYPDMIVDHFAHYVQYMDRPPAADFIAEPKKTNAMVSAPTPRLGNRFMIAGTPWCFVVVVGTMGN